MILKTSVKNHKEIKQELIKLVTEAPGTMHDMVAKTDWALRHKKNKNYMNLMLPIITKHTKKLLTALYEKHKNKVKATVADIWYQVYYEHSRHDWHTHGYTQFANVYYVDLPDKKYGTKFLNTGKINVEEGDILTFPSWYLHCSPVIKSKKRKIVIAYNLDIENIC
jgi:hypothetical protein